MRTRNKKLADHGVYPEDEVILRERCRRASGYDRELLYQICCAVAPGLGKYIFNSLTINRCGYDAQMRRDYIPATKADFYGYQRKALAEFYRILRLLGRWEDKDEID